MSERRAGLETVNVGADPPEYRGRPPLSGRVPLDHVGRGPSDQAWQIHRGSGDGMLREETNANTGSPSGAGA
jgi:hypothetical protein